MNILLIEDSIADVENIRILLNDAKVRYKLFEANTLSKGFDLVDNNPIDVVLLDLSVGDSTGLSTVTTWVNRIKDIPVVVLTGTGNKRTGQKAVENGAQDYIVKSPDLVSLRLLDVINYAITRSKNESELRKKNETLVRDAVVLKTNQQLAGLGAWEMDIVNNAMQWDTETFLIFGYKPNAFTPTRSDYMNVVHRDDRDQVERFFNQAVNSGTPQSIKYRIIIDRRIVKHISVRAQVKFDESTNRVLLGGTIQDITEKTDDTPVTTAAPSIPEAISLTPEQVFSQLSYNIRGPLNSINQLLFLIDDTALPPSQLDLFQNLKTAVDELSFTLLSIINYSLLASQKHQLNREVFNLPDTLEAIRRVALFKASQKQCGVNLIVDNFLPQQAYGDAAKISQFISGEFQLMLLRWNGRKAPEVRLSTQLSGKNCLLVLELRYNGEEPRPALESNKVPWDKIVRLIGEQKSQHEQMELASFINSKLSEWLEVRTELKNTRNKNEVHIRHAIPLTLVEEEALPSAESPVSPIFILLAEDHPVQQMTAFRLLSSWSNFVQVTMAKNGQEALNLAKEKTFDLILMDLQMPVMSGLEAITAIRWFSHTPIIAVTASATPEEEYEARHAGANDYLIKPFSPEDLFKRITQLLCTEP
jgi:CheY-like chemotaxis protein